MMKEVTAGLQTGRLLHWLHPCNYPEHRLRMCNHCCPEDVAGLADALQGILLIDEAYVDLTDEVEAWGEAVELRASVRSVATARLARERGLASIGLVRTEFLLPDAGAIPDRAFYAEAFGQMLEAADPLPVTFRLLDLAPDKHPSWASALPESGPLGLHGSRLYRDPAVWRVVESQLQALGSLTACKTVGLLVPNVDSVEQFQYRRASIDSVLPDSGIRVGAMLETAGAALAVDGLLATADLVGFGLNDLMQSLFGADRDLPAVRAHLDPYAPSLYRFLRQTAELAGPAVRRVLPTPRRATP